MANGLGRSSTVQNNEQDVAHFRLTRKGEEALEASLPRHVWGLNTSEERRRPRFVSLAAALMLFLGALGCVFLVWLGVGLR